jgi:hypothetical protein
MPPIARTPGKKFTAKEMALLQTNALQRGTSQMALRDAGPEVLPLITNWLTAERPTWKSNLQVRLAAKGYYFPRITEDRRLIAWKFLAHSGIEVSSDLLPFFATLTKNATNVHRTELPYAGMVLGRMFRNATNVNVEVALGALMPLKYQLWGTVPGPLLNGPSYLQQSVERYIDYVDPGRIYRPLCVLELGPEAERVGAAMELADYPRLAERAVPLLTANLGSTNRTVQENCAKALGRYGGKARMALPALTNLLEHPRERVRLAASNAIVEISDGAEKTK